MQDTLVQPLAAPDQPPALSGDPCSPQKVCSHRACLAPAGEGQSRLGGSAGTCLWTASSSAEPLRALRLRTRKKAASPARAPMSASATSAMMSPPHQGKPALELPCCEYGAAQAEHNPSRSLFKYLHAGRSRADPGSRGSHTSQKRRSKQPRRRQVLQAGGTVVLRAPEEALPAAATPGAGASPGAAGCALRAATCCRAICSCTATADHQAAHRKRASPVCF